MDKLKIAICDDDKADRDRICNLVDDYLAENNILAEVKAFNHPDSLLEECEGFRPHIYVLDIVMPMVTGIEAARELRWNQPDAQIIFATSESSFALESFDVNPINYIIKPVQKEKLFSTFDLALSRIILNNDKSIVIKVKGGFQTLKLDDILYIEYSNHLVTYHMNSGEKISPPTLRIGFLDYLEENHKNQNFVRCHESIAVNVSAIDKLTKTEVTLRNKEVLPVSKSRYADVLNSYMEYRF